MKIVSFSDEAERLNVPKFVVVKSYRKLINEGKLLGIIDSKNGEFVRYTSEDIENLTKILKSKSILLEELAEKLEIETEQVHLVLNELLEKGKITGVFTQNGAFIPDMVLRKLVMDLLDENTSISIHEISDKLGVPEKEVKVVIGEVDKQIVKAVTPYRQIGFSDLSNDIKLSKNLTVALLKRLIFEGRIAGSLDLVNQILVIDQTAKAPSEKAELRELGGQAKVRKPSSAWYLVPLFLGLIGSLIGYIAVKDEDKGLAENLLYFGIVTTVINIIVIWVLYSWWMSRILF